MTQYYPNPMLVFREATVDPGFVVEFGMAHYDGCFTPTGFRSHMLDPIIHWLTDNNIRAEIATDGRNIISFNNKEDMVWFLLRWQ